PDMKPLVEALNDLFWRRNQRTQHLKSAHQQAEHARLRATRLSSETRQMNEDLAKEVSVRRSIEVQLKNTQTLLDGILNAMPSALFALDARNRIVQCNEQAGDWLNKEYAQLTGLPLVQLIPELEKLELMPESPAETPKLIKRERISIAFGKQRMVTDILAYPLPDSQQARLVIRIDDVSQRQRMEEIMVQTEKMMTVGGLAAGMAHEINNPLGAILQNLQNARRRLESDLPANQRTAEELGLNLELMGNYLKQREIDQFFNHIQSAGERAAEIVANMLQFSRNDHLQKRDISITELVETTLNIAHNDLSLAHIELNIADNIGESLIHCVPSEIEQVLLNLLRNAQQALEAHQALKARQQDNDWAPRVHLEARRKADMVCLRIEDNGPGIPADVAPHIFEPFYTTKEVGEGTGLGLSVSYFIVTSHHQGQLSFRPSPLGGACFELCLPIFDTAHA
ncbi:MAG: ATP-binding protein, partial [Thalassolituus sp.]